MKPSPDQSSHAGSPGSPSESGRPARILIAEDDAGMRETLTTLVRGLGYDPVAAADGEAIPMAARILQVADVFDALTSDRPYRRAVPKAVALEALEAEARAGCAVSLRKPLGRAGLRVPATPIRARRWGRIGSRP